MKLTSNKAAKESPATGGKLPFEFFTPGAVVAPGVSAALLTEDEKINIRKLHPGWKDDDPVPSTLPQLAAGLRRRHEEQQRARDAMREMANEPNLPQDVMARPPLAPPAEIDESQMTAEQRAAVAAAFAEAQRVQQAMEQARKTHIADAPPGVNEAIQAGVAALSNENPAARRRDEPPPQRFVGQQPAPAQEQSEAPAGSGAIKCCPFCGFDLKEKDTLKVENDDKWHYLVAQRDGNRFVKEYKLLGGAMKVRFRSLTPRERNLIRRQLTLDVTRDSKNGVQHTQAELSQDMVLYMMCAALQYLWTASMVDDGIHIDALEKLELSGDYAPKDGDTRVRGYVDLLLDEVITTEDRRRILTQAYIEFQALCAKLEVNARNEDFFAVTGPRS